MNIVIILSQEVGQVNMENKLQIFKNTIFGEIRTIDNDGNPLFVGSDVAKALGYMQPQKAVNQHCRYCTKRTIPHPQSKDKLIEVLVIPQGDILRLVINSKLPSAQKFESWIFDEVIPSVLKTGRYVAPQQPTSQAELILGLAQCNVQLESKVNLLESKMQSLEKIITEPRKDWLAITKERIQNISGRKYQFSGLLLSDLYATLEKSKNILLYSRISRQQAKMKRKGATKKELDTITKLFVISLDEDLKLAFDNILAELEMKIICSSPARILEA
jgi:prophage antirepressor-like protein